MSKRNAAVQTLGEKARRLGTAGRRVPEAVKVNTQILELRSLLAVADA